MNVFSYIFPYLSFSVPLVQKIPALITLVCCVSALCFTAPHSFAQIIPQHLAPPLWTQLEDGLAMTQLPLTVRNGHITVLRFDPKYFAFNVFTLSEHKERAHTLQQWAHKHALVAAINASMYLPDGSTSTGYLRKYEHVNNAHIASRFGAFFLSEPKTTEINATDGASALNEESQKLPTATLVDRDTKNWQQSLEAYEIVVQNYRLISSANTILWSAGGQKHSIAAVANDKDGHILFLHCKAPISAHDFARTLVQSPINIHIVMYVEGGVQAGLVLQHKGATTFWGGSHPAELFTGDVGVALPNIIGVVRKKTGGGSKQ